MFNFICSCGRQYAYPQAPVSVQCSCGLSRDFQPEQGQERWVGRLERSREQMEQLERACDLCPYYRETRRGLMRCTHRLCQCNGPEVLRGQSLNGKPIFPGLYNMMRYGSCPDERGRELHRGG